MTRRVPRLLVLALPLATVPLLAQDTLRLDVLQAAARAHDPRAAQPDLLRAATALRLTTLDMERRPQLGLNGSASHQSDVTALALQLPNTRVPQPPRDRWQATVDAQQVLYDGGSVAARRAVERAQLAESAAGVEATLYRVHAEVNGAFFGAFLLQSRTREIDALIRDLDARVALARSRVVNGAALPRDTLALLAERTRADVARAESEAARRASLAVLQRLAGTPIDADASVLVLPDRSAEVARALRDGAPDALRVRPEFAQFERTRARLDREVELARVENRPRVVAFGQAGVGRPGLNQFRTDPDEFWQAGVRVEWRPWTWRGAERASEAVRLQQRLVSTEERAMAEQLARAVEGDLADITRLREALEADARLVALRQAIERQALAQFAEGVITAVEYVETRTDVLEATLVLERHRAELAQAEARFLTTLGLAPTPRASPRFPP